MEFLTSKTFRMNGDLSIAIHAGKDSEQIIKFIDFEKFTPEFQSQYNNGNIYGCYYDDKGNVVARDIWDDIHKGVLND